ncbi:MAG: hypothetical protein GKR88_13430 [Flavobacteriaceae bacterium]|nr:MAG: hypothetical protein GKR88_13430 [Flavobacteriaceae bacterium]
MKNVFFALAFMLVGTFAFANNTKVQNSSIININGITFSKSSTKDNVELSTNDNTKSSFCRVSCSVNIGGVEFSASAGNFLSSCERAGRRCAEKLAGAVAQFMRAPSGGGNNMPYYT